MIIYGNYHSNLCRILAAACRRKGIPCNMVHNVDDADPKQKSSNSYLIKSMGVKEFPCHKSGIAEAVKAAWEDLRQRDSILIISMETVLVRGMSGYRCRHTQMFIRKSLHTRSGKNCILTICFWLPVPI